MTMKHPSLSEPEDNKYSDEQKEQELHKNYFYLLIILKRGLAGAWGCIQYILCTNKLNI